MKITSTVAVRWRTSRASSRALPLLADAGINIRDAVAGRHRSSSASCGMIVSDWQTARQAAQKRRLRGERHRSGGGRGGRPSRAAWPTCWQTLESTGINIEYMYAFPFGRGDQAVLIFRFDKPDEAISSCRKRESIWSGRRSCKAIGPAASDVRQSRGVGYAAKKTHVCQRLADMGHQLGTRPKQRPGLLSKKTDVCQKGRHGAPGSA